MSRYSGTEIDVDGTGSVWVRPYENAGRYYYRGQTYFNEYTGVVYICTKDMQFPSRGFKTYTDTWKYYQTLINGMPQNDIQNITVTKKTGLTLEVKWKIPSSMTDLKNSKRSTGVRVTISIQSPRSRSPYEVYTVQDVPIETTSMSFSLERTKYFPVHSSLYDISDCVHEVRATLKPFNTYNGKTYGLESSSSYYFTTPSAPEYFSLSQDPSTNLVSATIRAGKSSDNGDRYDTSYTILTTYYVNSKSTQKTVTGSNTQESFIVSTDVSDGPQLGYDDYANVVVYAYNRGIYGYSARTEAQLTISYPAIPYLALKSVSSGETDSKVVFTALPTARKYHPTTNVRMQKLVSVDYENSSDIPVDASWQNVGPVDNGACTYLSIDLAELMPQAGTKTWVRLKAWNNSEQIYYRYSHPVRLTVLERPAPIQPSAENDYAYILESSVGSDGKNIRLVIGWDKDGTDDSDTTEISWSENADAWRSTNQPDTFEFEDSKWNQGEITVDGVTYHKSAEVYISDLTEGKTYYIAARRVLKQGTSNTYGPYSTKEKVETSLASMAPDSVVLIAPETSLRGEPISLSWTFGGDVEQDFWTIRRMDGESPSDDDITLAAGNDQRRFFNLPYYRDEMQLEPIFGNNSSAVTLYMILSVGGSTIYSEPATVRFLGKPYFELSVPHVVTQQPLSIIAFSNEPSASVSIIISSNGTYATGPSGSSSQTLGDTLYSGTLYPDWQLVSEYASQEDVQSAKEAMDSAKEAYDAALDSLNELTALREQLESRIGILEVNILEGERNKTDAENSLAAISAKRESMDEDDPNYNIVVQDEEEATSLLSHISSELEENKSLLNEASEQLEQVVQDIEDFDLSAQEEAYNDALETYQSAAASAIGPDNVDSVTHRATIQIPRSLDLLDVGSYTVEAFATNPVTNVSSERDGGNFIVSWEHQAPKPSSDIIIREVGDINSDFFGAEIELHAPTGSLSSDVYDIYRITKDGIRLAMSGAPLESTLIDPYAVFGSMCAYRIACRTADGDLDWTDYSYALTYEQSSTSSAIRIDWAGNHIKLDRNIVPSDSYEKQFVSHSHLDGTVSGHWNSGVNRTMDIGAAIIRGYDDERDALLRELAMYCGPVLIRTSDGLWLEGDAQIENFGFSNNTARGDVSIRATEISSTGSFVPSVKED